VRTGTLELPFARIISPAPQTGKKELYRLCPI
jgi:hypothetical protein